MHRTEEYRGFRIEAEAAEPIGRIVLVKIFMLESSDVRQMKEPVRILTYEPALECMADSEELMTGAIELARSGVDELTLASTEQNPDREIDRDGSG
jgi:hypothetical protein